jgi:hypothetical protein
MNIGNDNEFNFSFSLFTHRRQDSGWLLFKYDDGVTKLLEGSGNKKAPDFSGAFYRFRLGSVVLGSTFYSHLSSVSKPFLVEVASASSRSWS